MVWCPDGTEKAHCDKEVAEAEAGKAELESDFS